MYFLIEDQLRTVTLFQALQNGEIFIRTIKEILAIHENTLMKFFTSSMERLKNKTEKLSNENTLLKQEVASLQASADFQNKWFEEAKRDLEEMRAKDPIEEDIKLIEQKHQQLEEKISELEDRSRRNNLRFNGFTEKAEDIETWEEMRI